MEQVFVANLLTGDDEAADLCLKKLLLQFPTSTRVKRLIAMQHEFRHQYTEALSTYDSIITENPADVLSIKRKSCVYKSMGDKAKAMKVLIDLVGGINPNATTKITTTSETPSPAPTPAPEVEISPLDAYYGLGMNDPSCWMELAEYYIENSDYNEAVYCIEECILLDPTNCNYHTKAAEVYYSIGK